MKPSKIINIIAVCAALALMVFVAGYYSSTHWHEIVSADSKTVLNGSIPMLPSETGNQETTTLLNSRASILQIVFRLILAVLLSAVLAFRPRKNVRLFERNLYVAQTQILLAVVAAALMMIVGDNAARAFAIFAAVSLVRFRTNIRDPKEVTVLLICLALGLATGVGRWDLGIVLCVFVLSLLRLLEYREPEKTIRPMQLTIKTRNLETTQNILKTIFDRYHLEAEIRQIEPPGDESGIGCIVYYLNLRLNLSTDHLSEQIFALDPDNIEGIQWEQKKKASDIYQ